MDKPYKFMAVEHNTIMKVDHIFHKKTQRHCKHALKYTALFYKNKQSGAYFGGATLLNFWVLFWMF
jgi:hypothetical protein